MADNRVRIVAELEDKVSGGLQKIADKFDLLGGRGSAASLFGNVGAKAVAVGFGLIEQAAGGVENGIVDLVKAGINEEESLSRLRTALVANVPGWNNNTDAILATIKAHVALGFTEDEQRSSLTQLVATTHDVGKAFNVMSVAMDLARFKHISLADASDALTKVEAGSYRILKSLGIELPKNATQVQALAAVEKIAAGQAEAFASTTAGKLTVAQAEFGSVMEDLGTRILPLVATGADLLVSGMDAIIPVVDGVTGAVNDAAGVLDTLAGNTKDVAKAQSDWLGDNVTPLGRGLHGLAEDIGSMTNQTLTWIGVVPDLSKVIVHAGKDVDDLAVSARGTADISGKAFDDIVLSATSMSDGIIAASKVAAASFDQIITAADMTTKVMLGHGKALIDGFYDPLIAHDKLMANSAEIAAQKRILASSKSTTAEKNDARVALHQLDKDNVQYLEDLASAGGSGSKLVQKAMSDYLKKLASAHGQEKIAINAEIIRLEILAAEAYNAWLKLQKLGTSANSFGGGRASGGPVSAGQVYTVGEEGPETLVLGSSGGYVLPNSGGSGGSSGGAFSTVVHTHIYLDGRQITEVVDQHLATALAFSGTSSLLGTGGAI